MATFHVSTSVPTKHEVIHAWVRRQPWWQSGDAEIERLGSFHLDDPDGEVGMETHLLRADDEVYAVGATYRDRPIPGAGIALMGTSEHSVLGTRWIHDGFADGRYVMMLAALALTGQGPALGIAQHDGRWYAVPSELQLEGGGWGQQPVAVDGLTVVDRCAEPVLARNDRLELVAYRRPRPGQRPPIGIAATWEGAADSVVLASVLDLADTSGVRPQM